LIFRYSLMRPYRDVALCHIIKYSICRRSLLYTKNLQILKYL